MHLRYRHSLFLGLLFLLALAATWPLASRITTHVPGSDTWAYDEYTFIWSMWWFKHSLLDLHSSIFFSQAIFYPLGMELILYSYNLMAAILALPLGVAANWPLASNLSLLFSVIVSGFGAYLLALTTLGRRSGSRGAARLTKAAAVLAGIIFAFASNRAIYLALGHYNIHSVHYLPFFVLYVLRTMRMPTPKNILLAGLFGAFNLLVDMQYGVFMAFLGACLLLTRPLVSLLWPRKLALIAIIALALLFTWPYFWETVQSLRGADFLLAGWGDALKLSADLVGWFTPTALHPLWGVSDWPQHLRQVQEGTAPFRDVNTVFLGYVTVALAVVGAVATWRRTSSSLPGRGWAIAALLSALFTLGPLLQVRGRYVFDFDGLQTSAPMPFLLLHYLPFIQGNRAANRWSIVLMLALAILAAHGAAALWSWLSAPAPSASRSTLARQLAPRLPRLAPPARTFLAAALAAAILFEHAALPMPLTDARIPTAIQQLAALPDGAVLQIPMGWRNSFGVLGMEQTQAQYYQSSHGKPILSGNTSRNPAIKFDYFRRLPLVDAITRQEMGETPSPELIAAARGQAADLITLWGVRYLLLLPPTPGRLPYADTWQASQQLALDLIPHDPAPLIDADGIRVFAVTAGEPLPLDLDFGAASGSDAWRGAGWGDDESDVGGAAGVWATASRSQLLFRSTDASPRQLVMSAMPFTWPGAPAQELRVRLNGRLVHQAAMTPGWQEISFAITPQPGINHLWLEFSRNDSPRRVLSQGMIGSTGRQSPVDIEVHAFDEAFITLTRPDGVQTPASFGRRGYNVTVLDPVSGAILDQRGFDTVANAYEVAALTAYLNGLVEGQVVILATRGGAGNFISPDLVAALQRLGSQVTDPAALTGQAHALIGVVAPTGASLSLPSASEVIHPHDAFLRLATDSRPLAAAFDWLRIE